MSGIDRIRATPGFQHIGATPGFGDGTWRMSQPSDDRKQPRTRSTQRRSRKRIA